MFIELLILKYEKKEKEDESQGFENRRQLAKILEEVFSPLRESCSPHFVSNFCYLMIILRNFSKAPCDYNDLL